MKPISQSQQNNGGANDLSKLLREWRIETELPPAFQNSVWRRIDREAARNRVEISRMERVSHWLGQLFSRPALATAYFALLIAIGASAGWAQGRHEAARLHDELAHRYVQTLDPYVAEAKI